MACDLSIVVPAYNEAGRIVATLRAILDFVDRKSLAAEVILCADGADGTREAAGELARHDARVMVMGQIARLGKGRGVREGVLRGQGDVIGFVDADYKTPIEELDNLLPHLNAGADVVIGSRKVAGSSIAVPQPLYRRVGSTAFHAVMSRLVGLHGIADTQCGFKFFRREAAHRIFSIQQVDGYMFDVEILRLAMMLGYTIREVPVCWHDDGDSRYNPVTGTIRNARELLRIRRLRYTDRAA
jgi:dolichyl-phosphate beta-glucosyltransferase